MVSEASPRALHATARACQNLRNSRQAPLHGGSVRISKQTLRSETSSADRLLRRGRSTEAKEVICKCRSKRPEARNSRIIAGFGCRLSVADRVGGGIPDRLVDWHSGRLPLPPGRPHGRRCPGSPVARRSQGRTSERERKVSPPIGNQKTMLIGRRAERRRGPFVQTDRRSV